MSFWVYILRCADDSYYTGHTDELEKRIDQHASGAINTCYTSKRRPLTLVFSKEFETREEALAAERQIKGWSRKKKEAMMRDDWAEVSRLARSATATATATATSSGPTVGSGPTAVGSGTPSVRPELVEGRSAPAQGRPRVPSVHPSTSSAERTQGYRCQ